MIHEIKKMYDAIRASVYHVEILRLFLWHGDDADQHLQLVDWLRTVLTVVGVISFIISWTYVRMFIYAQFSVAVQEPATLRDVTLTSVSSPEITSSHAPFNPIGTGTVKLDGDTALVWTPTTTALQPQFTTSHDNGKNTHESDAIDVYAWTDEEEDEEQAAYQQQYKDSSRYGLDFDAPGPAQKLSQNPASTDWAKSINSVDTSEHPSSTAKAQSGPSLKPAASMPQPAPLRQEPRSPLPKLRYCAQCRQKHAGPVLTHARKDDKRLRAFRSLGLDL
ncbi:MAG: hypothetical protein Q9159_004018 [Coniocarpon cinnabarinum]